MSEANEKDTGEEQVEDVELQPETSTQQQQQKKKKAAAFPWAKFT
jgi:hypothetical protein